MSQDAFVLICPKNCPQWELAAHLALVKPKPYTKQAIAHRNPRQIWPRNARRVIEQFVASLPAARAPSLSVNFPRAGEHRVTIEIDGTVAIARRIALRLSRALPELWFVLPPWYVRNGVFYQRCGRYKLELVRTTRVRLRRSIRFGFLGDLDAFTRHRDRAGQDQPAQPDR